MTLDQVSKIVGIVRDAFIVLLITIMIGSAILIRQKIDSYFAELERTTTEQVS
jgi:hypothetical protein